MSAFQALGPFISTFANPNSTGLYFDDDGILRVQPIKEVPGESKSESKRTDEKTEPVTAKPVDTQPSR